MSDIELKAASLDGAGVDWPISYADIEPYYDLVEDYVGIQGMPEGLAGLPDSHFQPRDAAHLPGDRAAHPLEGEVRRTMTQGRTANLTQAHNRRQACHYCGPCEHGLHHALVLQRRRSRRWRMRSRPARCTLVTGAMVYKVLVDPSTRGRRGVLYIDRTTRQTARDLRAGCRALRADAGVGPHPLQLGDPQDANGLANSSGLSARG